MQRNTAGYPETIDIAKAQAKRLSAAMGGKRELSQAQALEMVAKLHGDGSWGEMRDGLENYNPPSSQDQHVNVLFTSLDMVHSLKEITKDSVTLKRREEVINQTFDQLAPGGIASMGIRKSFSDLYKLNIAGKDSQPSLREEDLFINEVFVHMLENMTVLHDKIQLDESTIIISANEPNLPIIDGKNTIAHVADINDLLINLKWHGYSFLDIMSKSLIADIWDVRLGAVGYLRGIYCKKDNVRALNPITMLKVMLDLGYPLSSRINNKITVLLIPLRVFPKEDVVKIFSFTKNMGVHIILLSEEDQIDRNILAAAGSFWQQPQRVG